MHRRLLFFVAYCQLSIPSTKGILVFADISSPLPVANLGPSSPRSYRCQDPGKTGRQRPKDKNTRPTCSFSGKQQVISESRQRGSRRRKFDLCSTFTASLRSSHIGEHILPLRAALEVWKRQLARTILTATRKRGEEKKGERGRPRVLFARC